MASTATATSSSGRSVMTTLLECFCNIHDPKNSALLQQQKYLRDDDDTGSYYSSSDDDDDSSDYSDEDDDDVDDEDELLKELIHDAQQRPNVYLSDKVSTLLTKSNVYGPGNGAVALGGRSKALVPSLPERPKKITGRTEAFQQLMKRDLDREVAEAAAAKHKKDDDVDFDHEDPNNGTSYFRSGITTIVQTISSWSPAAAASSSSSSTTSVTSATTSSSTSTAAPATPISSSTTNSPTKRKQVQGESSSTTTSTLYDENTTNKEDAKPMDVLRSIIQKQGYGSCPIVSFRNVKRRTGAGAAGGGDDGNFFLEATPEMIDAYDMTIINAVRSKDIHTIQSRFMEGDKPVQCCNRFGESILHTTVRCGNVEILDFLVNTAMCNVRVVCENGRTPLHDACWTTHPKFDCIVLLVRKCPDLLYIGDKRNQCPLDYVPRVAWGLWYDFLHETIPSQRIQLVPREIDLYAAVETTTTTTGMTKSQ